METNQIVITMRDNDFVMTLQPFAEVLQELMIHNITDPSPYRPKLTKDFIFDLWNKCCVGAYYLHQNQGRYSDNDPANTENWLKKQFRVWVGEEYAEYRALFNSKNDPGFSDGNGEYFLITPDVVQNF